jgi:Protein of unknown function (DUF2852)
VNVNNIHTEEGSQEMQQLVTTLDDYGKPAWIIAAVLGFIIWWPIGLGLLAYLIWSGRMGCGNKLQWKQHFMQEAKRFGGGFSGFGPLRSTGNAAFDSYREETLRRLEEEAEEFQTFLDRLRKARDKAEFDQFMAERGQGGPRPASA